MAVEKADLSQFSWLNQPEQAEMSKSGLEFSTSPHTDFWQRTHYGFRRASGHALLTHLWDDFSFSVQAEFFYETLYDQCGLFLYIDDDNWAKASVEYGDEAFGMLGSVVTNLGYSDWASSPIATDLNRCYYRISRRGSDFRFDYSRNGDDYRQMRVFHMHCDLSTARIGVYACSPGDSSFKVRFNDVAIGPSAWTD